MQDEIFQNLSVLKFGWMASEAKLSEHGFQHVLTPGIGSSIDAVSITCSN